MSGAAEKLAGGCLCGAVRFSATPEKREIAACHCSICRKYGGGPWLGVECGGTVEVEDPSKLGVYRTSDWAERCHCKTCGTHLFYRLVGQGVEYYVVSAGTFDDLSGFEFTQEIFIDDKPAHYTFANETSKMTGAEVFAAFAASQGDGNG
ncbi:MAG: GFA family protein [Rhizobiales bacterium]|nr:GFA family protein [Hyphomicrobiales bacterium]